MSNFNRKNPDIVRQHSIQLLTSFVAGVEAVNSESDFAFGRHTHDQFGIGLMDSGGQKSLSGRGNVESIAGDIITVNPGEVHDGGLLAAMSEARAARSQLSATMPKTVQLISAGNTISIQLPPRQLRL